LAAALGDRVRCDARVVSVDRKGRGYVVRAGESEFSADAVVLATPALASADLLDHLAPEVAAALRGIAHVSTGVLLFVYPEGTGEPWARDRRLRPRGERGRGRGPVAPGRPAPTDRRGAREMTEALYALYPVFKAKALLRDIDADDAAQEIDNLFKEWDGRIAV